MKKFAGVILYFVVSLALDSIDRRSTYLKKYDVETMNSSAVSITTFTNGALQCAHACLSQEGCSGGRYCTETMTCMLSGEMSNQVKEKGEERKRWSTCHDTFIFYKFKSAEDWEQLKAWDSCRQIFQVYPQRQSSIVWLRGLGKHYCRKTISNCGEGSWTLLMKIDGTQNTFRYESELWTNDGMYNTENCLQEIETGQQECKFEAYNKMPLRHLCLGMKVSKSFAWIELECCGDSLYSVIRSGAYKPTNLGRTAWKRLINGSSLQWYCNQEGFNTAASTVKARIGILGNEDNDCYYPDSVIGFGIMFNSACLPGPTNVSAGNIAYCLPDNGDLNLSAFAFIYGG